MVGAGRTVDPGGAVEFRYGDDRSPVRFGAEAFFQLFEGAVEAAEQLGEPARRFRLRSRAYPSRRKTKRRFELGFQDTARIRCRDCDIAITMRPMAKARQSKEKGFRIGHGRHRQSLARFQYRAKSLSGE